MRRPNPFAQHGETEQSLCPGRLVEARVVFVGREEVKVRALALGLAPPGAPFRRQRAMGGGGGGGGGRIARMASARTLSPKDRVP